MATLVFILNSCGLPRRALAGPTQIPSQNLTALRTDIAPPWVPEPDNRGTWSLLYSCIFTLVLCVWTAIHLNVPSYHESQLSQWLRKLKWVLLAIIAPEFGVYTACEQYFQAKKLIRQLAAISLKKRTKISYTSVQSETQLPQDPQESDLEKAASKRRVFSLTYGYFAVMGGLAVGVGDIDDRLHSVTLTPTGLKLLAKRGHFIDVSDDDIRDKSKANVFAKCLVILQVTWIALQTISRKTNGYPLSPLEIHTLVHAACASVMYILWFRKPLDVQAPTIVSKAGFEDLTALMLMQTPRLGRTWFSHLDPPKDFKPVRQGLRSEASFLMFDDSALSRRNKGCSSCGGHSTPSTTTKEEVADKAVHHAIHKTCENCVNLTKSERQQAMASEARILSSRISSHPAAAIRCGLPPGVKAVCELRSGDFTPYGIGLQPLMTWSSYHDGYVPLPWWCCFLRFRNPCPPKPALPAQISPALKEKLPNTWLGRSNYRHEIHLSLSEKDLKRWKLAGGAFLKEIEIQGVCDPDDGRYRNFEIAQLPIFPSLMPKTIKGWPRTKPLLARRCGNVNGESPDDDSNTLLLTLWLLGSLYGGIHLALWNYDFPTRVESRLWKISAVTLGSVPALLVPLVLLIDAFGRAPYPSSPTDRLRKIFPRFCSGVKNMLLSGVLQIFWPAALLYIFARIFIVVESFISLRHVPIGVYEGGLGWSKYIPHL